ncbi:MAG: DHH family phosphoesterase, partial [Chloroflexota bacterium]|nr:DHH family phosphoesterase [Chloroflexota bacterium]
MFYENENFKISIDDRNIEPSGLTNEKILKIILQNRNISDDEVNNFLQNYNINSIDPFEFPDMEKSIEIISKFITQGKKIGVYGDFDADGLTGTAILIETIDNLGGIAKPFIPHREDEGHGISKNGLMSLIDFGCELIITVDTGTNSFDLIEEIINEKNINFIITDHHIPEKKSFSYPILNPALDENITHYSGAGVAWILSKAIYQHFEKPMKEGLTSLATIGTVADVAPLQKNNRIIVKNGLIEIAKSQNFAINALNNISGKKFFFEPPEAEYISFSLAPRINTP